MLKKAIRDMYLQKRLNLTDEVWNKYSDSLITNFSALELVPVHNLLSYYPLSERKEFDISKCVPVVKSKWPQVKIGWPRIEPDMKSMEVYKVEEDGLYAKNKFNILEPINGEWMAPELIDLAFVPMVAFDSKGFRVGYGKGFYDRYLPRCKPDVIKVGFSFFDPVERIKDINDFDVPLNFCITPSRIYEF